MYAKRWTIKQLVHIAKDARSIRDIIIRLGLIPAGGNYKQIKKYIDQHHISLPKYKGRAWNKYLKMSPRPKIPLSEILIKHSTFQSYKLKRRLFSDGLKSECCEICGWAQKSKDGRIPVEIDHINGDNSDNRFENLRILCPNCHSLQPTHRGRNQGIIYYQ